MRITERDVERLATAGRLELTDADKQDYIAFLNAGLDFMDTLKQLDTGHVEPAGHVLPLKNVFREDTVQPGLDREAALANAPEVEDGSFRVPRIV